MEKSGLNHFTIRLTGHFLFFTNILHLCYLFFFLICFHRFQIDPMSVVLYCVHYLCHKCWLLP